FERYGARRGLHSFPTRRSSDLPRSASRTSKGLERLFAGADQGRPRSLLEEDEMSHPTAAAAAPAGTPLISMRDIRKSYGSVHALDRKSTRLNSSHVKISYAVFC